VSAPPPPRAPLGADEAGGYAAMALACVGRAYPNQVQHALEGDEDAKPPRALFPVFWGCYDWHSAVHGHWTLAAFARRFAAADASGQRPALGARARDASDGAAHGATAAHARDALRTSLTANGLAGERAYLERRPGFERPYGLAWLCALHGELVAWSRDPGGRDDAREAAAWAALLEPLASLGARRVAGWLERLSFPVRSGTHAQSAFGAGLVLDWARATGAAAIAARIEAAAVRLHGDDRGPALHLEPSGEDFLSPALGAAELVARVLPPDRFAAWLDRALPELRDVGDTTALLAPPRPHDRNDGRLVHLDGLNASRGWMLAAISRALPVDDSRRAALDEAADVHATAALAALHDQGYAGAHWLGTFALYLRISLSR
jgi:hypothetical protein